MGADISVLTINIIACHIFGIFVFAIGEVHTDF